MTPRAVLLVLSLVAAPAWADRDDHDRARRALEAGEILPLSDILTAAAAVRPGRVIEIELDREDGRWVYDLDLLTPEGQLYEIEINAQTGAVIDIEEDEDDD